MQTHKLETERNVLVEHEIKKIYSGVAVLTILYYGRNSKTHVRFSTLCVHIRRDSVYHALCLTTSEMKAACKWVAFADYEWNLPVHECSLT